MQNFVLEKLINQKLSSESIQDYAPNGLQIEGRKSVKYIITGVTASQALLNIAVAKNADAIIVHHGYFWNNESLYIKNMKRKRLKTILTNDINLYAWHLPLDIHNKLGNNVQLAKMLDIKIIGSLHKLVLHGKFIDTNINGELLHEKLKSVLKHSVIHCNENAPKRIRKLAWCTGSGQNFIKLAACANMDAFISGEISEPIIHIVREMKLHFYAAGHHATERGGIIALGNWLIHKYNFRVDFIDIHNPA